MVPAKRAQQNWLPSVFNDFFGNEWITKSASSSPAMNIKETATDFIVEIAAPGLDKDDFSVSINEDNQLVVSVSKNEEKTDKDDKGKYLRQEFAYTQFQQTMVLPDNIEKDKIEAKVNNGVLCIDIPKAPEHKTPAKNITVK